MAPGAAGRVRRFAAALALGAVMAAGQAPVGAWMIALPALSGLIWLVVRAAKTQPSPARAAFAVALAGGTGHFGVALSWIVEPFLIDVARHGWMAPFAVVFLSVGLALFWGLAGAVASRTKRPALGFAAALVGAEMLRGVVLTGFPWAQPGHIWIATPVDQLASILGANGLLLLTVVLAVLPVVAGLRGLGMATALGLAVAGAGQWRLASPTPPDRAVTLRLLQPNAAQSVKWDSDRAQQFMDLQLELTRRTPVADLTIWPETAVPYLMEGSPGVAIAIARASGGRPVAVGVQRVEGERFWNSLKVVEGAGAVTAVYDKHHLVPFGEYIPFGDLAEDWFGIRAFAAQAGGGYSAGAGPRVLDLGPALGKVIPIICYEAVFPAALQGAPERADWILQITNDAWFGVWTGPFQHAAQARLRAVEQGLPLVRVANTGVTAIIDARGRVRDALPFGVAGALDGALPGALPATLYARWGEWPQLLLFCGLCVLVVRPLRGRTA